MNFLIFSLPFLLIGCLNSNYEIDAETTEKNYLYEKDMLLDDCNEIVTSFIIPGRPDEFPRPPGWMPPTTHPAARVYMQGWECARVSWGPFERPALLLFESHNSLQNPPECDSDLNETIQHEMLNSIWVNDTDLVKYLVDVYGMPAYYSDMAIERNSLPVGQEYILRWGEHGDESWLSITDDLGQSQIPTYIQRVFWHNNTILGAMDFIQEQHIDMTSSNPAIGEMYKPMLMAKYGEIYASIGHWDEPTSAQGHIELFGDLECKEPL